MEEAPEGELHRGPQDGNIVVSLNFHLAFVELQTRLLFI